MNATSLRRQDGSVTAEQVAVVLLVAAVVAGLWAILLPDRVGVEAERARECLFGTECPSPGVPMPDPSEPDVPEEPSEPPPPGVEDLTAEEFEQLLAALPEGTVITDANGDILWESGDSATSDAQVNRVLQTLGEFQGWLDAEFGHDSWDDNGGGFEVVLNDPTRAGNAEWLNGQALFGEGMAVPDVLVHEFGHALDQSLGEDLDKANGPETAALSEGTSDVFAALFTQDWELGEDTPGGTVRDGSEDTDVSDWVTGAGSGHANANIVSHAMYEVVEGTGGLGYDTGGQIFYQAMDNMTSDATMSDYRDAMVTAATDLYGADSDEVAAVEASFDEVGITEGWSP